MGKHVDMVQKTCPICGRTVRVTPCRAAQFATCSKGCMGKHLSARAKEKLIRTECANCSKEFYVKPSHAERRKCCSRSCDSQVKGFRYLGEQNPNYRDGHSGSGYPSVFDPRLQQTETVHAIIARAILGVERLPLGFGIHHRDCDTENNDPRNLALLSHSDHKWLHRQFDAAVLGAVSRGKLSVDEAAENSSDPKRAKRLLSCNILSQRKQVGYRT